MFSRIEKKNDIIIFPVTKIHPNKVTNDALERRAKVKDFVKLTIVIWQKNNNKTNPIYQPSCMS